MQKLHISKVVFQSAGFADSLSPFPTKFLLQKLVSSPDWQKNFLIVKPALKSVAAMESYKCKNLVSEYLTLALVKVFQLIPIIIFGRWNF